MFNLYEVVFNLCYLDAHGKIWMTTSREGNVVAKNEREAKRAFYLANKDNLHGFDKIQKSQAFMIKSDILIGV